MESSETNQRIFRIRTPSRREASRRRIQMRRLRQAALAMALLLTIAFLVAGVVLPLAR